MSSAGREHIVEPVVVPVRQRPPPWVAFLATFGLGASLLGGILLFVGIEWGMLLWALGILLQVLAGAFAYFL